VNSANIHFGKKPPEGASSLPWAPPFFAESLAQFPFRKQDLGRAKTTERKSHEVHAGTQFPAGQSHSCARNLAPLENPLIHMSSPASCGACSLLPSPARANGIILKGSQKASKARRAILIFASSGCTAQRKRASSRVHSLTSSRVRSPVSDVGYVARTATAGSRNRGEKLRRWLCDLQAC